MSTGHKSMKQTTKDLLAHLYQQPDTVKHIREEIEKQRGDAK